MSYDYPKLQATATRLLTKYGQAATLTRWTKGAYNDDTLTTGTGSSADLAVTVVEWDFTARERDGTLIRAEDKRFILGGADDAPKLNDKLKVGGVEWEVISVEETNPGGTVLLYVLHVRR